MARSSSSLLSVLLLASAVLIQGCASTPPDTTGLTVEVLTEPERLEVKYRGRSVGTSPLTLPVDSFDDVLDIKAEGDEGQLVEKRVRYLSGDRVSVHFRFGGERSAMVNALGLTEVVIFDYSDQVTFDVDEAEIKTLFEPTLRRQAALLNGVFKAVDVYVCGHTDDTGGDEHNLELSLRRAIAVADFLHAAGVERKRLKPQGFGEDYPIAANDSEVGRQLNRRTEIVLPQ